MVEPIVLSRIDLRFVRYAVPRIGLELLTTVHVVVMLAVVEALVRWIPVPHFGRVLGCPVDVSSHPVAADPLSPSELSRGARRQLRCTHRVTDVWPLSRGPCLRRALVGGHLVRRLGPSIRLGTHEECGELVAHAWIEIGGRPLEDVRGYAMFELPTRQAGAQPATRQSG